MRDLVVVGLGQLGSLYADGAQRAGFRVTPVGRTDNLAAIVASVPAAPLLIAVGESDLAAVLAAIPPPQRDDLILLQNELFPSDWEPITPHPTVLVVWLNRKHDRPSEVARPTAVHGRHADIVATVHTALGLPCTVLTSPADRNLELVGKYAFIITVNGLGVAADRTVEAWRRADPARVEALVGEGVTLGEARLGHPVDRAAAHRMVIEALEALPTMPVRGRSAGARVARGLAVARARGIDIPVLSAIAQ